MTRSWKRRLAGGIALGVAVVLGSTVAATSLRADSEWSWEGAIIGGVIGGLIGSTHDGRSDRVAAVSVTTALAPFYDGPFVVHRHHGNWHRHPRKHRRGWHVWLGHQDPWHVHLERYHQWGGPRVQLRSAPPHPQAHQHRQAHSQRAHPQTRHGHAHRW